ncbi:hypothetical protein SARC_09331 [Sphaeroforma arctica JP610]|uniref:Uncharacterized protein n=1 Tax=Sphaeroforma arctica JP610 TaxID=667725 RepID=A0A0L0FNC8_9EUKA|nr:hypothetical protein SARC_09331 [Sphaeroforma arctica JP610]KNC78229.1 hypothetical protein SARC_09331 [Sphaeroforma arctica JP610]|eukprot:XP_014152131.1 hypothetical protein SARC_09331 [Sphaeroforma arctica JP610]
MAVKSHQNTTSYNIFAYTGNGSNTHTGLQPSHNIDSKPPRGFMSPRLARAKRNMEANLTIFKESEDHTSKYDIRIRPLVSYFA